MNSEKESNKLVPAICTQCGAKIEVDSTLDASICPYCSTAYIVEKAVKKYVMQGAHSTNVEHIDTVNINTVTQRPIGSALYLFDKHLDRRNQRKIEKERLKAEKARIAADREAREAKYTPLIVIASVIALIALLYLNNRILP